MQAKSQSSLWISLRFAFILCFLFLGAAWAHAQAGADFGTVTYPSGSSSTPYCKPYDPNSFTAGTYTLASSDYSVTGSAGTYNPPSTLSIGVDGYVSFYDSIYFTPSSAGGVFDENIYVTYYLNGNTSYPLTITFEVYGDAI